MLAIELEKFEYESPGRIQPAAPSMPNEAALDEAASILAGAENPVIITNWAGRESRSDAGAAGTC